MERMINNKVSNCALYQKKNKLNLDGKEEDFRVELLEELKREAEKRIKGIVDSTKRACDGRVENF